MQTGYINIQGWMREPLGLKGDKLLAYAIVYGFSQDGESSFRGGYAYLMNWLGCSKDTARRIMTDLTKEGLVSRAEEGINGKILLAFSVNRKRVKEILDEVKQDDDRKEETPCNTARGPLANCEGTPCKNTMGQEGDTSFNIENNIKKEYKERKSATFIPPTPQEVIEYVSRKGYHFDPLNFYAYYSNRDWCIGSGKKKMKDWRFACITFETHTKKGFK